MVSCRNKEHAFIPNETLRKTCSLFLVGYIFVDKYNLEIKYVFNFGGYTHKYDFHCGHLYKIKLK
ncbi:hypothetical protein psyc5s11_50360 [Clostridium gelidum]|uniref:Uncharacterized protein n=1 Tax=Clostridium gelidum TaxID=704125 RepID=A0ABN6J3T4_9CLOT|nr:hypothetical protein psyc5s11_50360 [Clostridium gelidum]